MTTNLLPYVKKVGEFAGGNVTALSLLTDLKQLKSERPLSLRRRGGYSEALYLSIALVWLEKWMEGEIEMDELRSDIHDLRIKFSMYKTDGTAVIQAK